MRSYAAVGVSVLSSILTTSTAGCRSRSVASEPAAPAAPTVGAVIAAPAATPPAAQPAPPREAGPTWTFGDVTWEVVDARKVERRERGGTARGWSLPEDITPTRADRDDARWCAFVDELHAWCAGMEGPDEDRHVLVYRTADGARTWRQSRLPRERYTEWTGAPFVTITVSDPRHVELEVVDAAQHHNMHVRTTWRHVSKDGGATWKLAGKAAKCLDAAHHCKDG